MIGKNTARIFPGTDFAALAIHTAMQTRKLQRMPRTNASLNDRDAFACAMAITDAASRPSNAENTCPSTQSAATRTNTVAGMKVTDDMLAQFKANKAELEKKAAMKAEILNGLDRFGARKDKK